MCRITLKARRHGLIPRPSLYPKLAGRCHQSAGRPLAPEFGRVDMVLSKETVQGLALYTGALRGSRDISFVSFDQRRKVAPRYTVPAQITGFLIGQIGKMLLRYHACRSF